MPVRTRDWLKFGTLVAIAFVFGLAFASTLNLPKKSGAAETLLVPSPQAAPRLSVPALTSAGDFQDAFVAGARHVKPAGGFIPAPHGERGGNQRRPPRFQGFFPDPPPPPPGGQGAGGRVLVSPGGHT